jgi:hypothetical protein
MVVFGLIFHCSDAMEMSHLALTVHLPQTVQVWLEWVNNESLCYNIKQYEMQTHLFSQQLIRVYSLQVVGSSAS